MGDALETYAFNRLLAANVLLLGRATYQEFVAAWPSRTNDPFADRMNSLPKFVVSKTLEQPEWNATVIDGDVADEVRRIKQQPGGDLLVYGSRQLVTTLLDHDLIDDIRIWVYPIVAAKANGCSTASPARRSTSWTPRRSTPAWSSCPTNRRRDRWLSGPHW